MLNIVARNGIPITSQAVAARSTVSWRWSVVRESFRRVLCRGIHFTQTLISKRQRMGMQCARIAVAFRFFFPPPPLSKERERRPIQTQLPPLRLAEYKHVPRGRESRVQDRTGRRQMENARMIIIKHHLFDVRAGRELSISLMERRDAHATAFVGQAAGFLAVCTCPRE